MKRIPRPSPAMVVAIIALIVAIGGTATALPGRFTVGRQDLKADSVGARALGRVVEVRGGIRSNDITGGDGNFTEAEGEILCPARAPFGFDPAITGLGPRAFEIQRTSILGRSGAPRGYRFRLSTDDGVYGYTITLNCLPRR
ncbi:MAG: hypothetical protein M9938_00290 [Solirubrobacterales bacterium]|nr:hypothetical protein [Solirubrobacterales bacterium]